MGSELPSSFVIPLDSSLVGGIAEPGLQFAGSPPALFIAEPTWDPSWAKWFSWHMPDIGAVILLIALVVGVWLISRLMRRGRKAGVLYCRGCEHELTQPQVRINDDGVGVWANEEAKCPECGKRDERGPERGARAKWKLVAGLIASATVCIAGALMLVSSVTIGGKMTRGQNETWPVAGLERVLGSWAPVRLAYSMSYQAFRFVRVDPLTGARVDLGTFDTSMPRLMQFVSPDGKYVIASARHDDVLVVIDAVTKQSRRASLAPGVPGFRGYLMVVKFSEDAKRVFVSCLGRNGDKRRDELFLVELATGQARSLAVVEFQATEGPNGRDSYSQFLVQDVGDDVAWVHQAAKRGASSLRDEVVLRWETGGEKHERTERSLGEMLMVTISDDAKLCVMQAGRANRSWAFALADGGDVRDVPAQASKQFELRRFMVLPDRSGTATVRDFGAFALPRGTLRVSKTGYAQFEQSKGDRFVAVVGDRVVERNRISRILGVPALKGSEVLVWDLQPLLDQKFGEQRAVPKKK